MTTLISSTNSALPKISYVKSIDVYLAACFFMVFASLIGKSAKGFDSTIWTWVKGTIRLDYTEKKDNQIFLLYKEIQNGAVTKSYMRLRKGFLIYEKMCKYLTIYEEAVSHIWLCNCSILNFLMYEEEENVIFFLSV